MYQIVIRARALKMMQEAYDWYEGERTGLGEPFLASLNSCYERISAHPEYFSIIEKQYRQVKLSHFPYVLIYEIMNDKVIVLAVFHTARNPAIKLKK